MEHLLEGRHLNKKYSSGDKKTEALLDVSFYLERNEILGIVGESGSGKSTLLKVISGMIVPDGGELLFEGKSYLGKGPQKTGSFLQMIFQDAQSSFDPRMTMKRSLLESGRKQEGEDRLLEMIRDVGLSEELLFRKPYSLSGGQCQRMAIARALYSGAGILLCDEITSSLDVIVQAQVIDLLRNLKEEGRLSVIFVSHDIELVSMLCGRIMMMENGRCIKEGMRRDIINGYFK